MKIVYADTARIEISDEFLIKAKRALCELFFLEQEDENCRYIKDIYVHGYDAILRVEKLLGVDEELIPKEKRTLCGPSDTRAFQVDLGEFVVTDFDEEDDVYFGWHSLIGYKDIFEIPDVYFNKEFLEGIVNPFMGIINLGTKKEFEEPYWQNIAFKIYEAADVEYKEWIDKESDAFEDLQSKKLVRDFEEKLLNAALNFYSGTGSLDELMKVLESKTELVKYFEQGE